MIGNNITYLVAHPDDEVIFGFPVLAKAKRIICCSNDSNNPLRAWCKNRIFALQEVGKLIGAEIVCFDYDSEFYRMNTRNGDLGKMVEQVVKCVIDLLPSYEDSVLFTHNSWGEYGHIDHILTNHIAKLTHRRILTTDIAIDAGWFKVENNYKGEPIMKVQNDLELYNKCKAIYEKWNAWTWSKQPIPYCNLYELCK